LTFVYDLGCSCRGLDYSPITGGDGNIEFLAWWHGQSDKASLAFWLEQVDEVVQQAWEALNRHKLKNV
jgi:23S rRNA (cytidine1920-2'-O)/16S rRNA (cytidine1409-2'-O)-methyltransferase